jgi:hypothetical protein
MSDMRSIVLRPVADEDALFPELDELVRPWFKRHDLFLLHDGTLEDEEAQVTTAVWRDAARPDFELRLVADDAVPMLYITVVPDDRTDTGALVDELRKKFDAYGTEELLRDVEAAPADSGAWTKLAIALGGEHHPRVEALLREGLASSDADALESTALASALLRWPGLVEPLRAALARDVPDEVRPALRLAIQACGATPG